MPNIVIKSGEVGFIGPTDYCVISGEHGPLERCVEKIAKTPSVLILIIAILLFFAGGFLLLSGKKIDISLMLSANGKRRMKFARITRVFGVIGSIVTLFMSPVAALMVDPTISSQESGIVALVVLAMTPLPILITFLSTRNWLPRLIQLIPPDMAKIWVPSGPLS